MKRLLSYAVVAGLISSLFSGPVFAASFSDLDQHGVYAKTEINDLYDKKIISGYNQEGTIFAPFKNITRQEFAVIVAKAYNFVTDDSDKTTCESKFDDVDDWAKPSVGALYSADITKGVGARQFGAHDFLTREQMASFLIRALGMEESSIFAFNGDRYKQPEFEDSGQMSEYARYNILMAREIGLITGDGKRFYPKEFTQRQAVARLCDEVWNKGNTDYIPKALKLAVSNATDVTYNENDQSFSVTVENEFLSSPTQLFTFTFEEVYRGYFEWLELYLLNLKGTFGAWATNLTDEEKTNALNAYFYTWKFAHSPYQVLVDQATFRNNLKQILEHPDYANEILNEKNLLLISSESGILNK